MVAQEPEMVTPAEAAVAGPSALQPDQSEPSDALLELYKMAVEMADRVSARRGIGVEPDQGR
jgi:hypothetical protein